MEKATATQSNLAMASKSGILTPEVNKKLVSQINQNLYLLTKS